MKFLLPTLIVILLLSTAASLSAGEVIIYGGSQKPGKISWDYAKDVVGVIGDIKGDFGGTFGVRYSAGRVIGFEQSIGYSPRFAKPGVKAFQTDSNLVIQAPGKIVPYATVGIGVVRTWGNDVSLSDMVESHDAGKIASAAFSYGSSFAVNYGGGIKVRRICGPLGFGIDVRGYKLPSFRDESLNFIQTTAGLVIKW